MKSVELKSKWSVLKKLGALMLVAGISFGGAGCRKEIKIGMKGWAVDNEDFSKVKTLLKFSGSHESGDLTDLIQSLQNIYGAVVQTVNVTVPRIDLVAQGSYLNRTTAKDLTYSSRVGDIETRILNLVNGAQVIEIPYFGPYKREICKSTRKKAGSNCAKVFADNLPHFMDAFSKAFANEARQSLELNVTMIKPNGENLVVALPVKNYEMDCAILEDEVYEWLINFKNNKAKLRSFYSADDVSSYYSCTAVATF